MPRKIIYTLTVDDDSGTDTQLFCSKAELDEHAHGIMSDYWDAADEPMPTDWRDAWEVISETADFWVSTGEHTIDTDKLEDA